LWRNGILIEGEDVGGTSPRTVTMTVANGKIQVKLDGVVTEL
jgi:chemotaxis receptor (MCP) glutamine deamidase CheD